MNPNIYLVGGYLRDFYLNRPSKDVDFALELESYEKLYSYLKDNNYEIKAEDKDFFRIKARPPATSPYHNYVCDYLLCRSEGTYSDRRHPDICKVSSIMEDLSRRDFTMNALAKNINTGEILDPFNGLKDIQQKFIVCVGNTKDRMEEDPLRILRALRFSITLNFNLSQELEDYMQSSSCYSGIQTVSMERIREELFKCFKFNTFKSLEGLQNFNSKTREYIFERLWLKPTLEN